MLLNFPYIYTIVRRNLLMKTFSRNIEDFTSHLLCSFFYVLNIRGVQIYIYIASFFFFWGGGGGAAGRLNAMSLTSWGSLGQPVDGATSNSPAPNHNVPKVSSAADRFYSVRHLLRFVFVLLTWKMINGKCFY